MRKFMIGDVVVFKKNCKTFDAKIRVGDIGVVDGFYGELFEAVCVKINRFLWAKCTPDKIEYIGKFISKGELR